MPTYKVCWEQKLNIYFLVNMQHLPRDIKFLIAKFCIRPSMRRLEWILPHYLDWKYLSANLSAIEMIEEALANPALSEKINWSMLSRNPAAMHIIEAALDDPQNCDKISWEQLCENPNAIYILEGILNGTRTYEKAKINWICLCRNPAAIHLIEAVWDDYIKDDSYYIENLCTNSAAIHLIISLIREGKTISWTKLSGNPTAIDLIREELKLPNSRINWYYLSGNPAAIDILEATIKDPGSTKDINWSLLCMNPGAIKLIEKSPLKLAFGFGYTGLCLNPNIFEVDTQKYKKKINELCDILEN